MVVLPFWKKTISVVNSCIPANLLNPQTVGDHIRRRRLSLSMKQEDVGKVIGVSTDCITYWENNRSKPMVHQMPQIIKFLGYNPLKIDNSDLPGKLKCYRINKGLSHKKLGKILGVDATTIGAWEKNEPISKKNLKRLFHLLNSMS